MNTDLKTTELNNIQMDDKNTPPPIEIKYKRLSNETDEEYEERVNKLKSTSKTAPSEKKAPKRKARILGDTTDEQTLKAPRGTNTKNKIIEEVVGEEVNDILAECLAELKTEEEAKVINDNITNLYSAVATAAVQRLVIGEELPPIVCEELPHPTFADASCQTDEVAEDENEVICVKCAGGKVNRKKDNPDYWKQYYAKNKDKLLEQKKEWRKANPTTDEQRVKKREYQEKYDKENKDKIKERREKLILCECGANVKAFSLKKHKDTETHKLKVQLRIARGEQFIIAVIPTDEEQVTF